MIFFQKKILVILMILFITIDVTSQVTTSNSKTNNRSVKSNKKKKRKKHKLPEIDLNHWKVTIPIGKPSEIGPPEIIDYANNETLKKYMYNDSIRGTLVFYAFPNSTTANTKYSRSELREQMVSGSNSTNWTFAQGGKMKGRLVIDEISRDKNGKHHKVIIMQIHGRLTNEQRDLIGQKDNNAPAILKIYWQDGKVRVKTKVLKHLSVTSTEILKKEAWTDDKGYTFKEEVGFKPFTLEIKVSDGKMVVSLNNNEFAVYKDVSIKRWGIFENYFKAGNYLQTKDKDAFARVKYFELDVNH